MVWTTGPTPAARAAARPRMPAFELWVWTRTGPRSRVADEIDEAATVAVGPGLADQVGDDGDLGLGGGGGVGVEEAVGAVPEVDVEAAAIELADREERVLLGAAELELGDDVDDRDHPWWSRMCSTTWVS
jgi:hypothetical protein